MRISGPVVLMLATLVLANCGGGGVSDPVRSTPVRTDLDYGYFQTIDGQLAATAGSVNFVFLQDDSAYGDPAARAWREGQQIGRLLEAQALGPRSIMLEVAYLVFDAQLRYVGIADAAAFHDRLGALGLLPLVRWLYVLDEPELHGVSDATMLRVEADLRAIWPTAKLVVVYSAKGPTPGISGIDLVGRDDYQAGIGVIGELPTISATQRYVLLPGGADPWRADPEPFLAYANTHPEVAMLMPFIWSSYPTRGATRAGIGTNGMAPAYASVGCRIVMTC